MKYHSTNHTQSQGMTLIEIVIYTSLLSLLVASHIAYTYEIQLHNINLSHEITDAENNQ
ncbi:MAG: hypothetical protein AAB381_02015 [Patescibacteria group bacterium]